MRRRFDIKKLISFVISLCLLAGGLSTTPLSVYAEDSTQTEIVVYVDGKNGLDDKDRGQTDKTPLKTMKAAYGKIQNYATATIVVIDEVTLAPVEAPKLYNSSTKTYSDNPNFVEGSLDLEWNRYLTNVTSDYYLFPEHNGEVVITSKFGGTTYENGALNFNGKAFGLFGNTTFENIKISSSAKAIFARFNDFTLGENITKAAGNTSSRYPAETICMGIVTDTDGWNSSNDVRNVCFTMNSGSIATVYGGNYYWTVEEAANYDVDLIINKGSIKNLYGTSISNVSKKESYHNNINITLNGGTVTNLYGAHAGSTVSGDVKITLKKEATVLTKIDAKNNNSSTAAITGDTILNLEGVDSNWNGMPSTVGGFKSLELTNSKYTIADTSETSWWSGVEKLTMTDDSTLTFTAVPTEAVDVTVIKAGTEWNVSKPLIVAPANTGNVFTRMAPVSHEFTYTSTAEQTTWTLVKSTELPYGEATNVDGVAVDIDLKLPKTYTPVSEDADAYDTYLAKLEDLTAAGSGKEVPVVSPVEIKGEVAIYVGGENASDTNKGTKDAPLATIQKALDYVAALQSSEESFAGIVVYLRGGTYHVTDSINITSAHSGKSQIPVIISAYNNEEVIISGGTQIAGSNFKPVNEISAKAYNKLPAAVRNDVVAVNLNELNISTDGAAITADGANYQVFVDGEELTLSRYPNATNLALTGKVEHIGYINFTGDSMGNKGDNADDPDIRFEMTDLRPTLWNNDGNIWLKGSLYAEWLIQNIRVKDINTTTGIITMDGGTDRGAKTSPNNTYYYYNILEELDVPGEYYLDKEAGILYMYPISDMSTATVTYSDMQQNIINLAQTKSVVLNGLTIECGANYGIDMTGCEETLVQNCTVRNLKYGVRIRGEQSGIIYSEICKTMYNPVIIGEGVALDYDYTPEENFLQNCYIHTTGNPNAGNIKIHGNGNVVSHNLLQGMNNSAIYLQHMKECIIEYNEITGAPTGVFDMGAIYAPHDIRATGTHVRYNYIHDIGVNSDNSNPHAIYFDEGLRGNYAYGNIMENVPSGFFTNSGIEHVVIHNIVANRSEATKTSLHGGDNFKDYTIAERIERSSAFQTAYEQYLALADAKKAEVKGRYPLLVKLFDAVTAAQASGSDGVGLFASQGNYVHENLIYNHGAIDFTNLNDVGDNTIATSNPFTNVDAHDFTLTDSSLITWADKLPSMDRIGILTTKEPISAFNMYAPSNGNQKVDPFKVMLKWSVAGGADDYVVKISKNADMSDARTIETIKRNCTFDNDEFFVYGTTYYWTVTANTTAESRIADSVVANNGAVYSFKTMTRDEYLAANPLDTTALEATITEAETLLAQVTEESDGGLYADGTYATLQAAIAAAKAVKEDAENQDQIAVNKANAVLADAIYVAETSRKIQYVTFEELSVEDWVSVTGKELDVTVADDTIKLVKDTTGQVMYKPGLGIRDILCFQYKIDKEITESETVTWHGFALAQPNENAYANDNNTDGYFICIKPGVVELQKKQGGAKVTTLEKQVDTSVYSGGGYYDIEIGAINNPDGSVGIHFKIDDTLIFDPEVVVDTVADNVIEGYGAPIVGTPFVNAPTFGSLVHRLNGAEYLKKANLTEETTGYVAGISTAESEVEVGDTILIPIAVSHDSDEKFNACEITITYDSTALAYDSTNSVLGKATVSDDGNGTLTLADYGEDKAFGSSVYTLAFTALQATDSTVVALTAAGFTNVENAAKDNLTPATLSPENVSLTIVAKVSVTLDTELFQGEDKASCGKDYTFSLAEDGVYYDYKEITATMGGNPAEVVNNGDGTYTIKNVTEDLVINCAGRTEKSYDVSFAGTGKTEADAVGNAATAAYKTDYTFKLPEITNEYVYVLESITIDGIAYTGYNAVDEIYTIPGADVKGDIVITVSKAENTAEAVTVTIDGAAGDVTGAATVKKGLSYTLTLNEEAGYVYNVTATMGGADVELTKGTDSADKTTYTIKKVTDAIVFNVEKTVDNSGVSVTQYIQLDGTVMWLVENTTAVAAGKVPTYNGEEMSWSDAYGIDAENDGTNDGAYCYLVISNAAEADVLTAAKEALGIATLTGTALEVAYDCDVNETGKVDASDAQLVWNMYKSTYADFDEDVTVEKFLEADVNKDRKVDTTDAAAIIDLILNK